MDQQPLKGSVNAFDSAEKPRQVESGIAKTPFKMPRHKNKSILGQSLTYKILRDFRAPHLAVKNRGFFSRIAFVLFSSALARPFWS